MGRQEAIRAMKIIPGFSNYCVTKEGNIYSRQNKKWLKKIIDTGGYLHVNLYNNKERFRYPIHHAVLNTFIGKCPKDMECRHLDGDKLNNELSNLCWGTHSENVQDTIRHGTHRPCSLKGEKHPNVILTEQDVRMIVYLYKTGLFIQKEIASWYNIGQMTVSDIITGKKWKHIWASKKKLKI